MIRIAQCMGALLLVSSTFPSLKPQQDSAVSSEQVVLRYVPKKGDRLQHNWLGTHNLFATQVMSQVEGKEPVSMPQLPSLETKERRVTTDWIQRVKGDRAQRVRRIWSDAEIWGKLDFHVPSQEPREVVLKSPLGNPSTSVVFTYVPEENGYGAYFDQSAMIESLLGGVRLDNSCANFLPDRPVQVGDSWDVELQYLIELLAPTGAMDYRQLKPGGAMLIRTLLMGVGGCVENVWNPANLKGQLRCKLLKVAGKGSLALAHIQLDYTFETRQDRAAAARELQMLGESRRGTIVIHNSVGHSGEGSGTLIWNMDLNRIHSYSMNGTETLDMEVQTQALHQAAVTQKMTLQGTTKVTYRVNPVTSNVFLRPWVRNPKVRTVPEVEVPEAGEGNSTKEE